ncbi:MAG: AAA family ATPase [Methylacidiphilales bacterium]|nr:AAA family ATPase [Candidatus Methylacidiphilales bacterium]NJR18481.1 AAA family ATPase [Calothrix sp. CSU_2_0]
MENREDQQYYIDFSSVRGGNVVQRLRRTIINQIEESTCQLFTGHIGCGKSTELFRLKDELERQGFHVVYFESSADLDMADVDVSDILLAITRQVSVSLESVNIRLKPSYFVSLFNEIADFLQTPVIPEFEFSLPMGIGKVTAKTKDSPRLRSQLRQYLEPRTSGILDAINQQILETAKQRLKQQGYKGLVVIIDNLDRVDISLKTTGRSQPEYLFIDRGEQLKKLNCHVVYTIPLVLIFSNELSTLTNRFGVKPLVLPMVTVKSRQGGDNQTGMDLLRQMVLARAFPLLGEKQRCDRTTDVFDSSDTLDRLIRVSGGHVRNLLVLLYSCLQENDPPIQRDCLEMVIREYRDDLVSAISEDEWTLLHQILQNKDNVKGEEEYQTLLRSMFLFEYRDVEGRWFDINPAIAESKKFKL